MDVTVRSTAPLDSTEARALTDRIRAAAENLWSLLLEAYERKAWKVLGHGTWQAYVESEFNMSRRNSYLLLDQGRVIRALEEATGDVKHAAQITQRDAQALKPVLPAVTEEIRTRVEAGEEPAVVVKQVVEQKREERKAHKNTYEAVKDPTDKITVQIIKHTEPEEAPKDAPLMYVKRRINTYQLKQLIDAAFNTSNATDEEIDALQTNDLMLSGLRRARDVLDRIITRHSPDAKRASR